MKMAKSLRTWRTERGMTQQQLGAAVGLKPNTIACYELGYRTPNINIAQALARALGVQVDEIDWPIRAKKGA